MTNSFEKYNRKRLRSSYVSVVVSIALVLFVLGAFGFLVINARNISVEVKENFSFTVMLANNANAVEVKQFQKELELSPYVKSTEYISKEEAAEVLKEDLNEDFVAFLGENPLSNSIDIHLKGEFVNSEQLKKLEEEYSKRAFVSEVVYDKPLIQLMNDNIERIGLVLIIGSFLLMLIAIGLINSSIRLSIYSKRFTIKTMQLVGATKSFIRRPFIFKSVQHGFWGALVAAALLYVALYYIDQNIPGLNALENNQILIIVFLGLVLIGTCISMGCTFFAMRKYLRLKTDQLYF
jgi:cell division transport system permease protein